MALNCEKHFWGKWDSAGPKGNNGSTQMFTYRHCQLCGREDSKSYNETNDEHDEKNRLKGIIGVSFEYHEIDMTEYIEAAKKLPKNAIYDPSIRLAPKR
jgi:hypothetical protein